MLGKWKERKKKKKNQTDEMVMLNDMERVYKSIVEQEENSFSAKILEDYKKVNFKIVDYKFKDSFSFLSEYINKKRMKLEERKSAIKERKKQLKEENIYDLPIKYDNENLLTKKKKIYLILMSLFWITKII